MADAKGVMSVDGDINPKRCKKPRRRSTVLDQAIFEATMALLAQVGYQDLTMEQVASRAGTGKAALYRRWPGRAELVLAAVRHATADIVVPDTGDLRAELLASLRAAADLLAGPLGEATRGLLADTLKDPDLTLAARTSVPGSGHELVMEILRRGAMRGEVPPHVLTPLIAGAGPALLRQHFLVHGTPIQTDLLVEIVDQVILPLVRI